MIKYIINAIKLVQEQQRQQLQFNVLIKNTKSESVKIRIPKKYISLIEVLETYGISNPEQLEGLIKGELLHVRQQKYDICEFSVIVDQEYRFSYEQLYEQAMYNFIKYLVKNPNVIKLEHAQRISPWLNRNRYSIKIAIERK